MSLLDCDFWDRMAFSTLTKKAADSSSFRSKSPLSNQLHSFNPADHNTNFHRHENLKYQHFFPLRRNIYWHFASGTKLTLVSRLPLQETNAPAQYQCCTPTKRLCCVRWDVITKKNINSYTAHRVENRNNSSKHILICYWRINVPKIIVKY